MKTALISLCSMLLFGVSMSQEKKPLPTYSIQQCRVDTQEWTLPDPAPTPGHVIIVNGQNRLVPITTAHAPIPKLLDRIYEMTICENVDADFQRQFSTYSTMIGLYKEEHHSRYVAFLLKHNLHEQFIKEDAIANE